MRIPNPISDIIKFCGNRFRESISCVPKNIKKVCLNFISFSKVWINSDIIINSNIWINKIITKKFLTIL